MAVFCVGTIPLSALFYHAPHTQKMLNKAVYSLPYFAEAIKNLMENGGVSKLRCKVAQ